MEKTHELKIFGTNCIRNLLISECERSRRLDAHARVAIRLLANKTKPIRTKMNANADVNANVNVNVNANANTCDATTNKTANTSQLELSSQCC